MTEVGAKPPYEDEFVPLPSGYSLLKLLLLHRHGERTTVYSRFPEHAVPFDFCKDASASLHADQRGQPLRVRDRSIDSSAAPFEPPMGATSCGHGQLTDRGAETCAKLGSVLRAFYVDRCNFLSPVFDRNEILYQSTEIPRAKESARFLLGGLYPSDARAENEQPHIFVRSHHREIIYPNWARCPTLEAAVRARHAELRDEMEAFRSKVPELFTSALKSTHAFFDENAVRAAHDIPTLPGTTNELMQQVEKLSVNEWFGGYTQLNNRSFCRLGMGPLLDEMRGQILHGSRKMYGYSGHDTSIGALLPCLGAFDGRWPKYASQVALEVLQREQDNSKFVQLRYNGVPRVMSLCAASAEAETPTLCPLDKFLEIIEPLIPSKEDYRSECGKSDKK